MSQRFFKDGQLEEWKSFDPNSKLRYSGKVTAIDSGQSVIDYYGGSNAAVLKCFSQDWAIESCVAIDGQKVVKFPTIKEFIHRIEAPGELKFKPDKCGGVLRTMDASHFVDHASGNVSVLYRTKEACPVENLATSMQCDVSFENGKWKPNTCILADGDSGQENVE